MESAAEAGGSCRLASVSDLGLPTVRGRDNRQHGPVHGLSSRAGPGSPVEWSSSRPPCTDEDDGSFWGVPLLVAPEPAWSALIPVSAYRPRTTTEVARRCHERAADIVTHDFGRYWDGPVSGLTRAIGAADAVPLIGIVGAAASCLLEAAAALARLTQLKLNPLGNSGPHS